MLRKKRQRGRPQHPYTEANPDWQPDATAHWYHAYVHDASVAHKTGRGEPEAIAWVTVTLTEPLLRIMARYLSALLFFAVISPAVVFGKVPLPQSFPPGWSSVVEPDTSHYQPVDEGAMYDTGGYCSVTIRVRAHYPAQGVFTVRGLPRNLVGPGVLERAPIRVSVESPKSHFEKTYTAVIRHPVVRFLMHYANDAKPENSRIWIAVKPLNCTPAIGLLGLVSVLRRAA